MLPDISRLSTFAKGRLPLRAPVIYDVLECQIVGRTFGRELYDVKHLQSGVVFENLRLEDLTVNFREIAA